jgi:hypothetical protein
MNVIMTLFTLIFINPPFFIHHIDYLVSPKPQAYYQGKNRLPVTRIYSAMQHLPQKSGNTGIRMKKLTV